MDTREAAPGVDRAHHRELKALFWELAELSECAREARLAEVAARAPVLAAELCSLLRITGADEQWAASLSGLRPLAPAPVLLRGERSYRVVRELGRGGGGVVYLAERADGAFRQQVAIKLLSDGRMSGRHALQRLQAERQILARLKHPHVATLLDGGTTTDGLPFLVMEYVEGQPIDRYCREHGLPLAALLRLFRSVCLAVHYAHQNLIVHRDLKPSNVLVTATGQPKLLDFGIARVLDPRWREHDTTEGHQPLTPRYASPEQLRGEPVGTLSDVFSLGLLLYELLTGALPRTPTPTRLDSQTQRALQDAPPTAPSRAPRGSESRTRVRIDRDLDAVVLKALRVQPWERYGSAVELADDITRVMEGRPVLARRASPARWLAKFVRRHAAVVTATTLLIMALLGALGASFRQTHLAARHFQDLRALANSFLFEFHDAIATLPGATPARELVVRRALHYLDRLSSAAAGDVALRREVAAAYQRVATLQGNPYAPNLGDARGALASYRRALALRLELLARAPDDRELLTLVADTRIGIGDVLWVMQRPEAAGQEYRQAEVALRAVRRGAPAVVATRERLASVLNRLGDERREAGDGQSALARYGEAAALLQDLSGHDDDTRAAWRTLGITQGKLGQMHQTLQDYPAARAAYERARAIHQEIAAQRPNDLDPQHDLVIDQSRLAELALRAARAGQGDVGAAVVAFEHTEALARRLAESDLRDARAGRDLAVARLRLADALQTAGQPGRAATWALRARAEFARLAAADPGNVQLRRDVSIADEHVGLALLEQGDVGAAIAHLEQALQVRQELLAGRPQQKGARSDVAWSRHSLGTALLRTRRWRSALAQFEAGVALCQALASESPHEPSWRVRLAATLLGQGDAWLGLARAAREPGAATAARAAARRAHERGLALIAELERQGKLASDDLELPSRLRAAVARHRGSSAGRRTGGGES